MGCNDNLIIPGSPKLAIDDFKIPLKLSLLSFGYNKWDIVGHPIEAPAPINTISYFSYYLSHCKLLMKRIPYTPFSASIPLISLIRLEDQYDSYDLPEDVNNPQ